MIIKYKNLHEIYLKQVTIIAYDEHFFAINNAKKYVISTYGRLFHLLNGGHHEMVRPIFYKGEEAYQIHYDDKPETSTVIVSTLMANVFFPNEQIFRLYNPYANNEKHIYRWKLENLHIIQTKEDLVDALLAKMVGEVINTDFELKNHNIEGGWNLPKGTDYARKLCTLQAGMHTRSTNEKYKRLHPQYAETTISREWLECPAAFKQYWLDVIYYHPEKLVVDKDIMGFGKTNCYAEGLVVPVPAYINDIFVRGTSKFGYCITQVKRKDGSIHYKIPQSVYVLDGERGQDIYCDTYAEALKAGRKRKAEYIRNVVNKERVLGYIPEYILEAMEQWAYMCEAGKIQIWEPSDDVKREMKII